MYLFSYRLKKAAIPVIAGVSAILRRRMAFRLESLYHCIKNFYWTPVFDLPMIATEL